MDKTIALVSSPFCRQFPLGCFDSVNLGRYTVTKYSSWKMADKPGQRGRCLPLG
jgi:hypothetical protein